jgi:hypothetical protein
VAKTYRSDIQAALQGRKVGWGYEPTVEAIPNLLAGETVRALAMGKLDGNKFAILVLSQSRVSLLRSSTFGRVSNEDLLLSSITSVEQKKGTMASDILLHASGNGLKLEWVMNGEAEAFAGAVRTAINEAKMPVSPGPVTAVAPPRRTSEQIKQAIRDLAELRDDGLLTTAQFEEKKAALLEEL